MWKQRCLGLLVFALPLAGCSGGGEPGAGAPPAPAASAVPQDQPAARPVVTGRKLIKDAKLELRVEHVAGAAEQIRAAAQACGGYVAGSEIRMGSEGMAQGSVDVKVPAEQLDDFLSKVSGWGRVLSRGETGQDVTDQFVDSEARLRNLKSEEERIQALMKSTGKLTDLLTVEKELTRVRGEIELLQGQLNHLTNQVSYSSVHVGLNGTASDHQVDFWDLRGTVGNAWTALLVLVRLVLTLAIYAVMFLPLILSGWWLWRRWSAPPAPRSLRPDEKAGE